MSLNTEEMKGSGGNKKLSLEYNYVKIWIPQHKLFDILLYFDLAMSDNFLTRFIFSVAI